MPPVNIGLNLRTAILEKFPVAVTLRLRDEYPAVAEHMRVEQFLNYDIPGQVSYAFMSFLANIHKQDKVETTLYKYPSTVWEYFKHKYAPAWVIKRWPVKYDTKKIATVIEKNFMCPHLAMRENGDHAIWMMDSVEPLYPK